MKNKTIIFAVLLSISGCSAHSDLDRWMQAEKEKAQQNYQRNHRIVDYSSSQLEHNYNLEEPTPVQPFSPLKLRLSYFPGADGVRGILESFDLSEMQYVGYLKNTSRAKGFINVDGQVYTISNGTPIGKNYGRVIEITPQKIVIRENVENFEGLWISTDTEILMSKDN
ncbi:MAG: pilus assembly protein PilP [Neisseriaceae bacterium]|nr:hypothetical protein [Neisseriaceae bacterium PsAf]MCV2509026.1 pilus assembly protein PilP [Neisseriaceae bacterium]